MKPLSRSFFMFIALLTCSALGQELSARSQGVLSRISRATGNQYELESIRESESPVTEIMGKRSRARTSVYSRRKGSGHLVSFSYTTDLSSIRFADYSVPHRSLSADKQISEAEAVERVRACAAEFQQNPYDRADVIKVKTSSELAGLGLYQVYLYEAPDGIPARTGNSFAALVDPRDGSIVEMTYRNISGYNSKDVSLTAEAARNIAVAHAQSSGFTGRSGNNGLVWYDTGKELAESNRKENVKAYELWVEKENRAAGHMRVWVDAQSGQVVGTASLRGSRQTPETASKSPSIHTFKLRSSKTSGKGERRGSNSSGFSWPIVIGVLGTLALGGFLAIRRFGRYTSRAG